MEFLKDILGDMYADFAKKIRAYKKSGGEIELADISGGKYVSKEEHDGVLERLNEADERKSALEGELSLANEKYEADTTKLKKDIDDVKFSFALDNAILAKNPKNLKAVKALVDVEGLKAENGVIDGLEAQLDKIMVDNPYLFDSAKSSSGMRISGGASATFDAFSESARKSAGM